jgi:dolichol-phosphate mannosyltransferase
VVPCYNEAEGIPHLCARLGPLVERLRRDGPVEVVFVDDGSTDDTAAVLRRESAALPRHVVMHVRNRGLGAALRTGFAVATGEEVVTLDSDCTYDPDDVPRLLAALRAGADVVTGSPYHPEGEVVGVRGWRLHLSKALSRLYAPVLPLRLHTYTSCFRAYRREVLPLLDLSDDGFQCVTRLLVSAILRGLPVAEVPSRLSSRRFGKSKIRVLPVGGAHLRYLAELVLRRRGARARAGAARSVPRAEATR